MADSIFGKAESFDPDVDDWDTYIEQLEQYLLANQVEDNKKVSVFITVIGKKAYAVLRNAVQPDKPADKTYQELVRAMKERLDPKPLIIAERFKFHRRNQSTDESIAQYLAELRKLAQHCEFGDYREQALRDRLVCGIHSEAIQKRLLAEENLTLKKAQDMAQGMEAVTQEATHLRDGPRAGGDLHHVSSRDRPTATDKPCYRCASTGHRQENCRFRTQKCHKCGKQGHISKACRSASKSMAAPLHSRNSTQPIKKAGNDLPRPSQRTRYVTTMTPEPEEADTIDVECGNEELPMWAINTNGSSAGIKVEVTVEGVPLNMELDTGASVTIVSQRDWEDKLAEQELHNSHILLKTYTGEPIKVLGEARVRVEYKDQSVVLPLVVVEGTGPPLFGRNWLEAITLDWNSIKMVSAGMEELLQQYHTLFADELGTMKGITARLEIKTNAIPKFCRARPVPYALRDAIERDLMRLEGMGVLQKVNYSDWATPVVPVPKADGSVRLCGDFKVTVNPVLLVDQHPIPKPEDLLSTLAGGQKFSKLDLSQAYQQMLLHPDDQKYTTINTHKGLYQYTRLPFGIASAPAMFQQAMEKILQGLPQVICYLDDVLVTGKDDEEHVRNLKNVLERLNDWGLRLKRSKCSFLKSSVQYLGYRIDADGLHTAKEKVKAIVDAPRPENVPQLRAFLGLVNYYGKFIPNLASIAHSLNNLLRKDTLWNWSSECEEAFCKLRELLSKEPVLVHYDPRLKLRLACDASPYGVGAVLSHCMPDGVERPIAFGSRTLSIAERNYAQIEKEALTIVYGIKKFHQYIFGRSFDLVTDHKPLNVILHPRKNLPALAAARIQRWAIILSGYQYEIAYKPTAQHGNADGLSRLPLIPLPGKEEVTETSLFNVRQIGVLPVGADQLRTETTRDPVLSRVLSFTQGGWPNSVSKELESFFRWRLEITVEYGCLMWGIRVIVPLKYRNSVLAELHTSHPGVVRMKSLARTRVWWPGLDMDIEKVVKECSSCQQWQNKPSTTTLHPWNWPSRPWQRLHIDYAGPFLGRHFLVLVDAHSKWPEVIPTMSTTTERTIMELRRIFATHGLPEQLVSDNGSQFTSEQFEMFLKTNGIKHIRSAPYHPATNGEAERFVQTFKNALKVARTDEGSVEEKLLRFLLMYRITPNTTTSCTPAELLLRRSIHTRLDLIKPKMSSVVSNNQLKQKDQHDHRKRPREFHVDQSILVENPKGNPKWLEGKVVEKLGPTMYRVQVQGQVWRRHSDQLLESTLPETETPAAQDDFLLLPSTVDKELESPMPESRYPTRIRQPPNRYRPDSN